MWFNSTLSEEPHQGLTCRCKRTETCDLRGCDTGAAWLSSARAVRCSVQSGNERNPRPVFQSPQETAPATGRKARMTSSQHGPYILGDTRGTMAGATGRETARWSKSLKTGLSTDWRLQLASMKLESLVNAHQPRRVEYVLGSCTHK